MLYGSHKIVWTRGNIFDVAQQNWNIFYGKVNKFYFWDEKLIFFDIRGTQRIFKNITFCLCYIFSLHYCYSKVFSPVGKNIDRSYLLGRSLRHNTIWYCRRNLISSRNHIFDLPWRNFSYALREYEPKLFCIGKTKNVFDILGIQIVFRNFSFCLCHRYQTH